MINPPELQKKLEQSIRAKKCTHKGCLSSGKDALDIVWFGSQFEEKVITCSSCFVLNDEALKKCVPSSFNVVPLSTFLSKFAAEAKLYQELKCSNNWEPLSLQNRQKQQFKEVENFQFKLTATLKHLCEALEGLTKKVIAANQDIFNNQIFNQIIAMNNQNNFEGVLEKIGILIRFLNIGEDEKYRFYDQDFQDKKLAKLLKKIDQVTKKVLKTLDNLLADLQERNSNITKI